MHMYDVAIIGGGPAGLTAAIAAKEQGADKVLIIEREEYLGGALNQCIDTGFGYHMFHEELTGPEYSQRMIDRVKELNIFYMLNSMVIELTKDKIITVVSGEGIVEIKAGAVVLAMGSREMPRGSLNISGSNYAGVFTAGEAQKIVNLEGYMPGKQIVILGSGDIGLVMAKRLTLEGAVIKAVVELMPYPIGSEQNVEESLSAFKIPLKLSYAVIDIRGNDRVEGLTIAKVDENKTPIYGTEEFIACDTILLSVGLFPEVEILRKAGIKISASAAGAEIDEKMQTNVEGIYACGNIIYVHDVIDDIVFESCIAGENAAKFVLNK